MWNDIGPPLLSYRDKKRNKTPKTHKIKKEKVQEEKGFWKVWSNGALLSLWKYMTLQSSVYSQSVMACSSSLLFIPLFWFTSGILLYTSCHCYFLAFSEYSGCFNLFLVSLPSLMYLSLCCFPHFYQVVLGLCVSHIPAMCYSLWFLNFCFRTLPIYLNLLPFSLWTCFLEFVCFIGFNLACLAAHMLFFLNVIKSPYYIFPCLLCLHLGPHLVHFAQAWHRSGAVLAITEAELHQFIAMSLCVAAFCLSLLYLMQSWSRHLC